MPTISDLRRSLDAWAATRSNPPISTPAALSSTTTSTGGGASFTERDMTTTGPEPTSFTFVMQPDVRMRFPHLNSQQVIIFQVECSQLESRFTFVFSSTIISLQLTVADMLCVTSVFISKHVCDTLSSDTDTSLPFWAIAIRWTDSSTFLTSTRNLLHEYMTGPQNMCLTCTVEAVEIPIEL